MTAYYFAARYSRHPEMRDYRDALIKALPDAVVTSRWIDQHAGTLPNSFMQGVLNSDPEACWKYGLIDMTDLDAADVVVSFTTVGGGKGGRHIEHGYAIAKGKRLAIVGPRENIFHAHPATDVYGTWDEFLAAETWRSADLSARLSAKPDPDPETCPLDCTCDEDETCGCWCDVHDCPIAECPSFKLVDSWLRDAAEKRDTEVAQLRAELAEARTVVKAALAWRVSMEGLLDDISPEEEDLADALDACNVTRSPSTAGCRESGQETEGYFATTSVQTFPFHPKPVPPVPDVDGHGGDE